MTYNENLNCSPQIALFKQYLWYIMITIKYCIIIFQLLGRLNKVHITLSAQSKKNIVTECSEHCEKRVINEVAAGHDGKLNGDNVDIFVTTNDIRMKNKNKDYHFFATDWTPYRLLDEDFNENEYLKQCVSNDRNVNVSIDKFQPNVCEYKQNIKVLVARMFINH